MNIDRIEDRSHSNPSNRFNGGHLCEHRAKYRHSVELGKHALARKHMQICLFVAKTPLTITRIKEEAFT